MGGYFFPFSYALLHIVPKKFSIACNFRVISPKLEFLVTKIIYI